jgi:hypothetical protein
MISFTPPKVGTLLEDKEANEKQLFYYKFPSTMFIPGTEEDLYIYVTGENGTAMPDWLDYEEVSMILSGTPNGTA